MIKEPNVWTRENWGACSRIVNAEWLRGRKCYAGLDISSKGDIGAWVKVFPPLSDEDDYRILCKFFIPDSVIAQRARKNCVPYVLWALQGHIELTPGEALDYEWVLHQIDEDLQRYDVCEVAFDAWGATEIQAGLKEMSGENWLVRFEQSYRSMSPPMKELERLMLERKLAHGNNPVLNWMVDNLVVKTDSAGNIKPDREKSTEKINGMVALVMALGRALTHEPPERSLYEEQKQ